MAGIENNNRIIAEFMGWIHHEDKAYDSYEIKNLKYISSWESLMPVVDRIETLQAKDGRGWINYVVSMDSNYCVISLGGEEIVAEYQGESRIDSTYQAVIKFIEYWNSSS